MKARSAKPLIGNRKIFRKQTDKVVELDQRFREKTSPGVLTPFLARRVKTMKAERLRTYASTRPARLMDLGWSFSVNVIWYALLVGEGSWTDSLMNAASTIVSLRRVSPRCAIHCSLWSSEHAKCRLPPPPGGHVVGRLVSLTPPFFRYLCPSSPLRPAASIPLRRLVSSVGRVQVAR